MSEIAMMLMEIRTANHEDVHLRVADAVVLYEAQAARITELEAALDDHNNTLKHAMEGRSDEAHCGCCAPLRARVAELEAALRELAQDDRDEFEEDSPEWYSAAYCNYCGDIHCKPWCPRGKARELLESQ